MSLDTTATSPVDAMAEPAAARRRPVMPGGDSAAAKNESWLRRVSIAVYPLTACVMPIVSVVSGANFVAQLWSDELCVGRHLQRLGAAPRTLAYIMLATFLVSTPISLALAALATQSIRQWGVRLAYEEEEEEVIEAPWKLVLRLALIGLTTVPATAMQLAMAEITHYSTLSLSGVLQLAVGYILGFRTVTSIRARLKKQVEQHEAEQPSQASPWSLPQGLARVRLLSLLVYLFYIGAPQLLRLGSVTSTAYSSGAVVTGAYFARGVSIMAIASCRTGPDAEWVTEAWRAALVPAAAQWGNGGWWPPSTDAIEVAAPEPAPRSSVCASQLSLTRMLVSPLSFKSSHQVALPLPWPYSTWRVLFAVRVTSQNDTHTVSNLWALSWWDAEACRSGDGSEKGALTNCSATIPLGGIISRYLEQPNVGNLTLVWTAEAASSSACVLGPVV